MLRLANENGCSVVSWGGGTKQGWGYPVTPTLVLEMHRLNVLREHTWQDMTCTVEAGCTWASLQSGLAQHGQFVALDPLWPEKATIGGIVANLPNALASLLELGRTGALSVFFILGFLVLAVAVVAFIVFMERAQRRIAVQYPKRQVGNRMFGGDSTHMPLKLNTSGVIPPIFASSILLIPATIAGFSQGTGPGWLQFISTQLAHGQPLYMGLYAAMIIFFSYFYTAVVFNPQETADNLKKYGGFIPGIRPGSATADYFDTVLTRLTTVGALYLVAVCLLPEILISDYGLPFYFGGTSILIVVSVTMDTVTQIQSHLLAHQYEGLIRKARVKGRR